MAVMSEAPSSVSPLRVVLEDRAHLVERILEGAAPVPPRWVAPAYVARVELIRSQLRPIRSVDMLLASYGREARLTSADGYRGDSHAEHLDVPLELAYALRLIELETGIEQKPWTTMVRRAAESRYESRSWTGARNRPRIPRPIGR